MKTTPGTGFSAPAALKVLTPEQVEQFMEQGYVMLPEAFPRDAATAVRNRVWKCVGLSPDQPEGWTKPYHHLTETFTGPDVEACYTRRIADAFDDLLGPGRWERPAGLGWWPVIFPGFDKAPWRPPTRGWHVDGSHFHHRLTSREQGLLAIFLFSDMDAGDGGTAFDVGSHKIAAGELLAAEPAGLDATQICKHVNRHGRHDVRQLVGRAGDVALLHPFMNHAASANIGSRVRFICNACIPLKENMNLHRAEPAEHSPVEEAIRRALEGMAY